MDTDKVFDHVIKDHNLSSCNIEEELHIAAKLGRELLLQNDAIREKNRMLWEVNEEHGKEIEMLRQQNKLLREEAESKANEQIELEKKSTEMELKIKSLEKEMIDLQSLTTGMRETAQETERLYLEETRRSEVLERRVSELEKELDESVYPTTLSPVSPRKDTINISQLQNNLTKSEEKRRGLESELKLLLEENCDLFSKIKQLEDMYNENKSNCSIRECETEIDNASLNSTVDMESECSTIESLTSESWLTEKLTTLEERYNSACDNCICGACEPIISPDQDAGDLKNVSYQELFDQLFSALHSIKLRTPRGTLKRKQATTPKKPHMNSVFDNPVTPTKQ